MIWLQSVRFRTIIRFGSEWSVSGQQLQVESTVGYEMTHSFEEHERSSIYFSRSSIKFQGQEGWGRNQWPFVSDILKCNFLKKTFIPFKFSCPIANKSSLVQIMAWCKYVVLGTISKEERQPRGRLWMDEAVFDFTQVLAYLVHNMNRSQLYLRYGHFGYIFFSVNSILVGLWSNCFPSVEIIFFLLADMLLQYWALFQC